MSKTPRNFLFWAQARTVPALILWLLLAGTLPAEVFTGENQNDQFTIHGRLHYYNGSGEMRIWIIGSKRMLEVAESSDESGKINAILADGGGYFSRTIYGDFTVEPLRPDIKGAMRPVRIVKVRNVVVERDEDKKLLVIRKEL